jgi:hypothetical protein
MAGGNSILSDFCVQWVYICRIGCPLSTINPLYQVMLRFSLFEFKHYVTSPSDLPIGDARMKSVGAIASTRDMASFLS